MLLYAIAQRIFRIIVLTLTLSDRKHNSAMRVGILLLQMNQLHWHKSCYAKYTDKGKISRLRKFLDSTNTKQEISASNALRSKFPSPTGNYACFVKTGKRPENKNCAQLQLSK